GPGDRLSSAPMLVCERQCRGLALQLTSQSLRCLFRRGRALAARLAALHIGNPRRETLLGCAKDLLFAVDAHRYDGLANGDNVVTHHYAPLPSIENPWASKEGAASDDRRNSRNLRASGLAEAVRATGYKILGWLSSGKVPTTLTAGSDLASVPYTMPTGASPAATKVSAARTFSA